MIENFKSNPTADIKWTLAWWEEEKKKSAYDTTKDAVARVFGYKSHFLDDSDIMIKAAVLNNFYSTNIRDVWGVMNHYKEVKNLGERYMKKLISILVLFISIILGSNVFAYDFEANGIYYNITSSNTVEVTYQSNTEGFYSGTVVIPSNVVYNGVNYSVTSIGNWAFSDCSSLTSVTIPNSVTSIEYFAFSGCSSLISVTIGNSVTSIGRYAFENCSALTSVTIPNSVNSIGNSAFFSCTSLTSITIPNSVTSIGDGAFSGCSSLTDIDVNSENNYYSSVDGVLYNKEQTKLIRCPEGKVGIVSIPNSVTSIGDYAFEDCSVLTSVTIGNSVTFIGDGTFYGCTSLDTIICLGNRPAYVKEGTFYNNQSNMTLIVPCGKSVVYQASPVWKWFGNIVENCEQSSIDDVIENTTVSLYPNPTNENTTLNIKGLNKQADIIVTNQQGQIISNTTLAKGNEDLEMETSNLPSGIYYIRIQTDKFVKTERLIKK